MKNKLSFIKISIVSILFMLAVLFIGVSAGLNEPRVSAGGESPALSIEFKNLSYSSETYLLYAVEYENVSTPSGVKMLFWSEPQAEYTFGTEDYYKTSVGTETIAAVTYHVFYSDGIAPKDLIDYVYCRAYYDDGEDEYYSDVVKYSPLDYLKARKETPGVTDVDLALYNALLDYAAAAQVKFDHKADTLINGDFYEVTVENGTLEDGFTFGLYADGQTVTVTADPAPAGKTFYRWVDDSDNELGTTSTLTFDVDADIEVIAEYINYTEGLAYTLNGAGTEYSVTGIGTAIDTDIVIPATYNDKPVTSIGNNAFYNCSDLTSIMIPESVTSILSGAFRGCSGLTGITIPYGITNLSVNIFLNCSGLTSVTLPDSVISIGASAFENCSLLTGVTIPDNVTNIGAYAFFSCSGLTSIIIPDSVTSIGTSAFSGCSGLTSVTIGSGVTSIGEGAYGGNTFFACNSLTRVYYSGTIESWCNIVFGNYVANPLIYAHNLYINDELTEDVVIEIPENATTIGYNYSGWGGLSEIIIPDSVTSIGEGTFHSCIGLISITIGEGVTTIGDRAFFGCTELTSVTIPDNVTRIGYSAFIGCNNLSSVAFENTSGWWVSTNENAVSGTDISSGDLSNTSTAATYLTSTYNSYYWKRDEE